MQEPLTIERSTAMFRLLINLCKSSTYKKLEKRYNQIAIKKRSANHIYAGNLKCRQAIKFFKQTKKRLHLNKIDFNVESRNRLNASSTMISVAPTMNLTKGDLKYLSINDIKALLGHEFGHFYARLHHLEYDMFGLIFSFLLILIVYVFIGRLSGMYQVVTNVISTVLLAIALVLICDYSFKKDEYFADNFGVLLTNKHDMIVMITKIHDYQKQKLTHIYYEMEQLKTVPFAYLECRLLYTVGLIHYLCETKGLCVHPTASKRIEHVKHLSCHDFRTNIHKKLQTEQKHANTSSANPVNNTIHKDDPSVIRFIKRCKMKISNYKRQYKTLYIAGSVIINIFLCSLMYTVVLLQHYSFLMNIWYFICFVIPFLYKYVRTNLLWNSLMIYKIHLIKHQSYSKTNSTYQKIATIAVAATILFMFFITQALVNLAAVIFSQIGPLSIRITKYLKSL